MNWSKEHLLWQKRIQVVREIIKPNIYLLTNNYYYCILKKVKDLFNEHSLNVLEE